jgi:hypothetical protein
LDDEGLDDLYTPWSWALVDKAPFQRRTTNAQARVELRFKQQRPPQASQRQANWAQPHVRQRFDLVKRQQQRNTEAAAAAAASKTGRSRRAVRSCVRAQSVWA